MGGFTHESAHNESKEWYTPPEIFLALGCVFDLDPCYPPEGTQVSYVPTRKAYTIKEDGLSQKWEGFVWMNPPYGSDTKKWMRKLSEHGDGIALVFSRTDTSWFHEFCTKASAICFMRSRISFIKPDGIAQGNAGCGSMLVGFGAKAKEILINSKLGYVMSGV